ncbi:MAG: two pore domain potassium channel family protein [Bacteroides sp.]|nr:two pore domain potassium channel family protein [Bacteroides sp.]
MKNTKDMKLTDRLRHFWHVVSNVRPVVWILSYIGLVPVFAVVYWLLPDGQFRIPDNAGTDFGSWLYYSIVTITTLGFGDYTPAHGWAQCVTAVEVMCGLVLLGFFLNAVGSMKSEIDVESEREKQRRLHEAAEHDKLKKLMPVILHQLNLFISSSDALVKLTPKGGEEGRVATEELLHTASRTSLMLDSMQSRIDLSLWPQILEDSFAFVAACQMFDIRLPKDSEAEPSPALTRFVKETDKLARSLETALTEATAATTA